MCVLFLFSIDTIIGGIHSFASPDSGLISHLCFIAYNLPFLTNQSFYLIFTFRDDSDRDEEELVFDDDSDAEEQGEGDEESDAEEDDEGSDEEDNEDDTKYESVIITISCIIQVLFFF